MSLSNREKLLQILQSDAAIVNQRVDLSELSGKHIIITGASGLIGINFLMSINDFFEQKNIQSPQITAIFSNDLPDYLETIINFKNLNIKKGDVTNENFIDSLTAADYIIHAAGYGQPAKFMQDKIKTIAINTTATISLLKKLKSDGKFLFVSTSEVYSGLSGHPFNESEIGSTNTTHPRACYIESKKCGEVICHTYFEKGFKVKSARLSLAYGPGTKINDLRVLNSFIEKGLNGKIEMMDKGEAIRTYCYVSDAIEIMWKILLLGQEPIYNVGGFSNITIAGLAIKIGKALGAEVIIPQTDHRMSGAPETVELDLNLIAKEFNKTDQDFINLDQGLHKTIAWQQGLYQTNNHNS